MKIITLIMALFLLVGCVVYPESEVYAPLIIGSVVDENDNPIVGAKVSRIESRRIYENKYRYKTETYYSQAVHTDSKGMFVLPPQSQIDWWHAVMDLPFIWCYGDFAVTYTGYETFETKFGDYSFFNEKSVGCKGVKFEPVVSLQSSN